jgi:hypothetical protein
LRPWFDRFVPERDRVPENPDPFRVALPEGDYEVQILGGVPGAEKRVATLSARAPGSLTLRIP